jgi:hypothetical protein
MLQLISQSLPLLGAYQKAGQKLQVALHGPFAGLRTSAGGHSTWAFWRQDTGYPSLEPLGQVWAGCCWCSHLHGSSYK